MSTREAHPWTQLVTSSAFDHTNVIGIGSNVAVGILELLMHLVEEIAISCNILTFAVRLLDEFYELPDCGLRFETATCVESRQKSIYLYKFRIYIEISYDLDTAIHIFESAQ